MRAPLSGCIDDDGLYAAVMVLLYRERHGAVEYRSKALPPLKNHGNRVTCDACGKNFKNKHTLACHTRYDTRGACCLLSQPECVHPAQSCERAAYL